MKYRFILGIARSGTTWVGDLLAMCNDIEKLKFFDEPFPKLNKTFKNKFSDTSKKLFWFQPFNCNEAIISSYIDIFYELPSRKDLFRQDQIKNTLKREDKDFSYVVIKDVHNLGIYPRILQPFNESKTLVITRESRKVLDSRLATFGIKGPYFSDEFEFLKKCFKSNISTGNSYIDFILFNVPVKVKKYLKGSIFYNNDVVKKYIVTEIFRRYLILWADHDESILHITHESLCLDPQSVLDRIYRHFGFTFNQNVLKNIKDKVQGTGEGNFETNKNSKEIYKRSLKTIDSNTLKKIDDLSF